MGYTYHTWPRGQKPKGLARHERGRTRAAT